jgi:hypothetical protein
VIDNQASEVWDQARPTAVPCAWTWGRAHALIAVALFAASFALVWLVEQAILRTRIARRKR